MMHYLRVWWDIFQVRMMLRRFRRELSRALGRPVSEQEALAIFKRVF